MTPASYLPSQVTEVFSQGRAFAVAKLPRAGLYNKGFINVYERAEFPFAQPWKLYEIS